MRLLEASLLRQSRSGQGAGFDAPNQFETEQFMKVGEVHKAILAGEISFGKTKNKRNVINEQSIKGSCSQNTLIFRHFWRAPKVMLTACLLKAITLKLPSAALGDFVMRPLL